MMTDESLRAMACRPWDGVWRIKRPDGFDPLLNVAQFSALQVLRSGVDLSEAEARLLQGAYYHPRSGPAQQHNLEKLTRRASQHIGERIAA
uniref:Uncharacterized protein n=1 Tax=viral metagenome TaxID=1070528 RepID=A0A6M3XVX9_9ZZZZ